MGTPVGTVLSLCPLSAGRAGSKLRARPRESRHPSSNQDSPHLIHVCLWRSGTPPWRTQPSLFLALWTPCSLTLAQPFPSLGLFSLWDLEGKTETRQPGQLRPNTQSVLNDCALNLKAPDDILGFPGGSAGKESTCHAGDLGSIPRLGRSPGEGKGYPLQYSGLENSTDYIIHGVTNLCSTTALWCSGPLWKIPHEPASSLRAIFQLPGGPRWSILKGRGSPILGGAVCKPRQDNLKGCGESPSGSGIR